MVYYRTYLYYLYYFVRYGRIAYRKEGIFLSKHSLAGENAIILKLLLFINKESE